MYSTVEQGGQVISNDLSMLVSSDGGGGGGGQDLSDYQKKNDRNLQTTAKTVVGAINENKNNIDKIEEDEVNFLKTKGFVSDVAPAADLREGLLWFESNDFPSAFPIQVKTYTNGAWSSTTSEYTPVKEDIWLGKDQKFYYYSGTAWTKIGGGDSSASVDDVTIEENNLQQIQLKDSGITFSKLNSNLVSTSVENENAKILRTDAAYKELLNNTNSTFEYNDADTTKDVINLELQNNNGDVKIDKTIDFNDKLVFENKAQTISNKTLGNDLDVNGMQLLNATLENLNGEPTSAWAGRLFYNTATDKIGYYNNASEYKEIDTEIINVNTLPATDIKTNSFYRYQNEIYQYVNNNWKQVGTQPIIDVNALPATDIQINSFYRYQNEIYQYVNNDWKQVGIQPIVDVAALPTIDIQENSFYRCQNKIYQYTNSQWKEIGEGEAIVDVNTLPTTDIKTNVLYRIIENGYNYEEDFIEEANVICYSVDGTVITISATGLTDNTNTSNPVTYTWENLTDAIIESFGSNVEVVDFVKDTNHFCKYDTDKYDIANEFTETTITELYHNIDGTSSGWNSLSSGGGGTNNYNDLIVSTMPKINGVTLKGNKTTEQLGINPDTIIDVETLPITDIKDNVFYRVPTDEIFKHNGESYSNIVCFQCDSDYVTIDATGITDTYSEEEPVIYTWENLTDDIINLLMQPITVDEEEKYPISITDFSKDVNHFCKYGDNLYDTANNFTKTFIYQLFSYVDNSWVNNSSYNFLSDTPNIDNVKLTENTTRQDIKLIGEDDIKKDSEFINPKSKGIDIVLNTGTSDNPNIINDDPAYKYANNKTSSNNYINTRLETIERKADAKTLTKFVDALPANPDINTEYYVETSTPNVYDRYFVDSIGTVKEIGNTTMDVSTLATKTELNLKEDLSNKTTTLDDNSTNTQYPSAKAVVDLVNSSSSVKLYKHNIKWGNGSTNFCYFSFISTRSTPYTDKVEMAKDMIALGISATSPVNCYNSYNQQGLLYIAYYTENGTMYYKLTYEASSYSASNRAYLMGDTVTPLYSIATAGSPICVDASSDVGITLSWGSSIMQASKEYYKVRFDNKTKHTFNLNIMLCGNNYSAGTQYKLTNTAITGLDLLPATDYQSSLVCATAIKHQTTVGGSTFGYVICSLSLIDKNIYFYFSNAVSFSQSNKYCLPIHFEWWK